MQKAEAKIRHFTDLFAWQKAHVLTLAVYRETKGFPSDERFGLTSQMRRSATSIKSNIAEGFGRQSNPDKIQFYVIARGSSTELQDQLLIAKDLGYISPDICEKLTELTVTVNKIINGLIRSIRSS
ncbi:four helix bundle protein [Candidatus Saccharibacteria bacterium]|nr:four helix bundle protein [Candidatus Saccharibacteria bacterium]